MDKRRVVIIGAGHVGAHVASALAMADICEEIILIDKNKEKAWAHAVDLQDRAVYVGKEVLIRAGGYEDVKDARICVISASGNIFHEDRLEELDNALDIIDEILPHINRSGFNGTIVSITNPCDLIALYASMKTEHPVIGTGTALDSARFRVRIGQALGIAPAGVEAFCIGEHGDSQVQIWSQVRIGGRFLEDLIKITPDKYQHLNKKAIETSTTEAGWAIVKGKGSTEYGIGAAAAEVIKAILRDSRQVMPCSVPYRRTPDSPVIYTSMPAIVGADGSPEIIPLQLTETEQQKFDASCVLLEQYRREKLDIRTDQQEGDE
ncbi:MAG: lactate/malate family dehydrogenase [Lachnospiraceae bacterium]